MYDIMYDCMMHHDFFAARVLVDLTDFSDLHCSDLLLFHLLLNLGAHDFGTGQRLNELFIIQNVACHGASAQEMSTFRAGS